MEQLLRDEHHQQNNQDAGNGDTTAPAERIVSTKQCHSCTNEPLTQLGVNYIGRVGSEAISNTGIELLVGVIAPGGLVAVVPQRPGVFDIEGLIKNEGMWVA